MTRNQKIGLILVLVIASIAGFFKGTFFDEPVAINPADFDRELRITKSDVEWEFAPAQIDTQAFVLGISNPILKADNTLDFAIWFTQTPVILESVLGSQLGKQIFQITNQTISSPDTIRITELDMSKFNPFEPIRFHFIYEYDLGARARHSIEFELN